MPAPQVLTLDLGAAPNSVTVVTNNGGNWLRAVLDGSTLATKVNAASGAGVTISADSNVVRALACGESSGYLAVKTASAVRVISVSLLVGAIRMGRVSNSASYMADSIEPGGLYTPVRRQSGSA